MIKRYPLLSYREEAKGLEPANNTLHKYNILAGLWESSPGIPMIAEAISLPTNTQNGPTSITETRERIDTTEGTQSLEIPTNIAGAAYRYQFAFQTVITKTREGVDQSESST